MDLLLCFLTILKGNPGVGLGGAGGGGGVSLPLGGNLPLGSHLWAVVSNWNDL